ncbi:MAG: SCO family protein [Verrucomicrobiota bacterium]
MAGLLPEQLPFYEDRGTNQVTRLRGFMLAAFEQLGLPDAAVPFVIEALESDRQAYLVAAAAKALRGSSKRPPDMAEVLIKALVNMRHMDDSVSFSTYKPTWPAEHTTNAHLEILRTLEWLGGQASNALPALESLQVREGKSFHPDNRAALDRALAAIRRDGPAPESEQVSSWEKGESIAPRANFDEVAGVNLIDQDGQAIRFDEFFSGLPSVVVFFYTRCSNPKKCSLTVTKLGELQRALQAAGWHDVVKTAAITYDVAHDGDSLLKTYGTDRGYAFSSLHRMFRTAEKDFRTLRDYFDLGVNYSAGVVNQHRVELYLLNQQGAIAKAFVRLQWEVDVVKGSLGQLIGQAAYKP